MTTTATPRTVLETAPAGRHRDPALRLHQYARQEAAMWRSSRPGWRWASLSDLVADRGVFHTPAPWPGRRPPYARPGRCFATVTRYLDNPGRRPGLTYVEGLTLVEGEPFPFDHAWLTDADGRAFDPSLPDGMAVAYLGVPVPCEERRRIQQQRGTWAVFTACHDGWTVNETVLKTGWLPARPDLHFDHEPADDLPGETHA
jgi:hypothetical protein